MASRSEERRTNLIVGVFVVSLTALLLFSLLTIAVSEGWGATRVGIKAHFRTVSGLSLNSKVQLAGKEIGRVRGVEFISPTYPCRAGTEDLGPTGVRSDECDPTLFCAPEGLCAELEPFTGNDADYQDKACVGDQSCGQGEICVSGPFRARYPRVRWSGPQGWCVRFSTEHRRVEVAMEIEEEKLTYIRSDSRATVASNGVLGDQLINITVGVGEAVPEDGRIQSTPSLMEELNLFKERIDGITDKVDRSLAGIAGLFRALNNDNTKNDLKGIIANANEISRQVKDGEGVVGALLNDPVMKEDVSKTLRSTRNTVGEVEITVKNLNRDISPAVRNIGGAAKAVDRLLTDVNDPQNKSVIGRALHDEQLGADFGRAVADAAEAIGATREAVADVQVLTAEVSHAVTAGEGTLGKLIKDPKVYDDLVKLIGNAERNNVLKKLVRFVVEQDEMSDGARPSRRPAQVERRSSKGTAAADPDPAGDQAQR